MTLRIMGDATHKNVAALASRKLGLVAGYVTGSPDIAWTHDDWAKFPGVPHVTIDQGFTGSPVPTAMVRDVEPGAWTAEKAVDTSNWTAERPTIYCDRSDLVNQVIPAGWTGDVWLAWPEPEPMLPPVFDSVNVVAVQFKLGGLYDLSVVFDDNWPHQPPPAGPHRVIANGQETVAQIAAKHGMHVPELIGYTITQQYKQHGELGLLQRALLDHLAHVVPVVGTNLWVKR